MTDLQRYEKEEGLIKNRSYGSEVKTIIIDRNIMHDTRRRLRYQKLIFINGKLELSFPPQNTVIEAYDILIPQNENVTSLR